MTDRVERASPRESVAELLRQDVGELEAQAALDVLDDARVGVLHRRDAHRDVGLDLRGHGLELVLQEVGADRARHHGVRGDRVAGPSPGRLDSEEHVGGLGLPVRQPWVVGPSLEVDVVEDDR